MTPLEEINRIKKEYKEQWHRLENHPGVLSALAKNDPIKLGEIAAMVVYGSYQDLATAKDAGHRVRVYVNYEPIGFDSLESAKVFIAHKRTSDKTANIGLVAVKSENGCFVELEEWEKYDDVLNSNDSQWTQKARALMKQKKIFVVVNLDFSFGNQESRILAHEFNYTVSFNTKTDRAFFNPRKS